MTNAPLPNPCPTRKRFHHTPPPAIDTTAAFFFITICAETRGGTPFVDAAAVLLDAARFYHERGKWFVRLFLVMPDHLHAILHVPPGMGLAETIRSWKRYLAKAHGIRFQEDFFDTRLRDAEHFQEKWNYIRNNPVAKGLVATPDDWLHQFSYSIR